MRRTFSFASPATALRRPPMRRWWNSWVRKIRRGCRSGGWLSAAGSMGRCGGARTSAGPSRSRRSPLPIVPSWPAASCPPPRRPAPRWAGWRATWPGSRWGSRWALGRMGLEPDYLAGTSIGAAVAGLHAMGYDTEASAGFLDALDGVFFRPTVSRRSLLSNAALAAKIREICLDRRIEDLPLPLAVVAADLETGREIVFRRGLLWLAVLGSSSIPGVHPALRIGPYTAVDGGIVNPIPSSAATAMGADKVVAVRLGRPQPASHDDAEAQERLGRGPSAIETILRSVDLMQATIRGQRSPGTIVIAPECEEVPGIRLRRFSLG